MRLLLCDKRNYISEQGLIAAVKAWRGEQVNWGRIVLEHMQEELMRKRDVHIKTLTLDCGLYVMAIAKSRRATDPEKHEPDRPPPRKKSKGENSLPRPPAVEEEPDNLSLGLNTPVGEPEMEQAGDLTEVIRELKDVKIREEMLKLEI